MPKDSVEVVNLETNDANRAVTNDSGYYAMFKAFTLHEGIRLQFRAEAFNGLNAPQLGAPSTSLNTTAAGQVGLTQTNDPRNFQIAAKILF